MGRNFRIFKPAFINGFLIGDEQCRVRLQPPKNLSIKEYNLSRKMYKFRRRAVISTSNRIKFERYANQTMRPEDEARVQEMLDKEVSIWQFI